MNPLEGGTLQALSRRIPSVMRSEFGRVIENLMDVPGSMGAVLVDDDGYAIDYVYNPKLLDDIDIQIVGAQLGQSVLQTFGTAAHRDLGTPTIVLEGKEVTLVASPVGQHYVLTFVMDASVDPSGVLGHFEAVRSTVEHLLT
ncbi:MAG: hypothetical protein K0V04_31465 [Deltaproteobacteria bacterium]|nr:hypothetical protein [Deltaproteobacteria bacterium]